MQALELPAAAQPGAAPEVRDALSMREASASSPREALEALAMLADPADHGILLQYLHDKDDKCARRPKRAGPPENPMDRSPPRQGLQRRARHEPAAFRRLCSGVARRVEDRTYSPLQYLLNS